MHQLQILFQNLFQRNCLIDPDLTRNLHRKPNPDTGASITWHLHFPPPHRSRKAPASGGLHLSIRPVTDGCLSPGDPFFCHSDQLRSAASLHNFRRSWERELGQAALSLIVYLSGCQGVLSVSDSG
jgi:hypothetical protein